MESVVIPDGVTTIESELFCYCENLVDVKIPDSVTSIEDNAFLGTGLYNTKSGVIYADTWVIYCYNDITTAIIKDGTRGIDNNAFRSASKLEAIDIPESVEIIAEKAFNACSSLETIIIRNADCDIYMAASTMNSNATIYGHEMSSAEGEFSSAKTYATTYDRKFVSIDTAEPPVITTVASTTVTTTTTTQTSVTTTTTTEGSGDETPDLLIGDANLDGKVNVRDCAFIASALAKGISDTLPVNADFNEDGKINVRDAAAIANYLANGKKN